MILIPFSWAICIYPALSIDTNNGHICGHIMPFHDSHYGHFDHFGYYGLTQYGPEYGHHWCLWKDQEKCRSTMKTGSKKLQRFKSYGQIKIYDEIRTSLIFWPKLSTSLWDPLGCSDLSQIFLVAHLQLQNGIR